MYVSNKNNTKTIFVMFHLSKAKKKKDNFYGVTIFFWDIFLDFWALLIFSGKILEIR